MRATNLGLGMFMVLQGALANPVNQGKIPNGYANGKATGHTGNCVGSCSPTQFRYAFKAESYTWTTALCNADFDGDGQSNGLELGDPCCLWAKGDKAFGASDTRPAYFIDRYDDNADISLPGDKNSVTSRTMPDCSVPPPPTSCNGRIAGGGTGNSAYVSDCSSSDVAIGSYCTLSCSASGYSGSVTALCKADGSFASVSSPTCTADPCSAIPNGGSGNQAYTSGCASGDVDSGTSCALTCSAPGYSGSSIAACTAGSFTGDITPTCTADPCSGILDGGSGNQAYTSGCASAYVDSGNSCTLTCSAADYVGSSTAVCSAGTMVFTPPSCSLANTNEPNVDCNENPGVCDTDCVLQGYEITVEQKGDGAACVGPKTCTAGVDACPLTPAVEPNAGQDSGEDSGKNTDTDDEDKSSSAGSSESDSASEKDDNDDTDLVKTTVGIMVPITLAGVGLAYYLIGTAGAEPQENSGGHRTGNPTFSDPGFQGV